MESLSTIRLVAVVVGTVLGGTGFDAADKHPDAVVPRGDVVNRLNEILCH